MTRAEDTTRSKLAKSAQHNEKIRGFECVKKIRVKCQFEHKLQETKNLKRLHRTTICLDGSAIISSKRALQFKVQEQDQGHCRK